MNLKEQYNQRQELFKKIFDLNDGTDWDGVSTPTLIKILDNQEKLEKIRKWYAVNQIHIPSEEAIKIIAILEKEN